MISLTSLRNPLISFLLFLFYHYTMMLSLAFSEVLKMEPLMKLQFQWDSS